MDQMLMLIVMTTRTMLLMLLLLLTVSEEAFHQFEEGPQQTQATDRQDHRC
jgi:hypothetical protein